MAETDDERICQICGTPLDGELVWCARCGTPHHQDCWQFAGVCSTYGCGSSEVRTRPPSGTVTVPATLTIGDPSIVETLADDVADVAAATGSALAVASRAAGNVVHAVGLVASVLCRPGSALVAATFDAGSRWSDRPSVVMGAIIQWAWGMTARRTSYGVAAVVAALACMSLLLAGLGQEALVVPVLVYVTAAACLRPFVDAMAEVGGPPDLSGIEDNQALPPKRSRRRRKKISPRRRRRPLR